jgi:hypothetical protein
VERVQQKIGQREKKQTSDLRRAVWERGKEQVSKDDKEKRRKKK